MTETTPIADDRIDAIRYRWLRDQPRKSYYKIRPFAAPYVVDPVQSRLYAVTGYTKHNLDAAIDSDILSDLSQYIYEQKQVQGDIRFADPQFLFSDEFCDECEIEAKAVLQQSNTPHSPSPVSELTAKDAGHFYNLVMHALMDVNAPHGGCKDRLTDIAEQLEVLMQNPNLNQPHSSHEHLSVGGRMS